MPSRSEQIYWNPEGKSNIIRNHVYVGYKKWYETEIDSRTESKFIITHGDRQGKDKLGDWN